MRLKLLIALAPIIPLAALTAQVQGARREPRPVRGAPATIIEGETLRVMTLNLAHGRGDGPNQILRRTKAIRGHLDAVAALIRRARPHVVGFQEADGPSAWSGRFDHVAALVGDSPLRQFVRAENVRKLGLAYGAALAAVGPLSDARAHTFAPTFPTPSKGFIHATLGWRAAPTGAVDVVSVHLDFASSKARARQVREMIEALRRRAPRRPLIVMGDFNCGWGRPGEPLQRLARSLGLRPVALEDRRATFPTLDHRIDWILISGELEAIAYDVLPDVVSDHRAVVAELRVAAR